MRYQIFTNFFLEDGHDIFLRNFRSKGLSQTFTLHTEAMYSA